MLDHVLVLPANTVPVEAGLEQLELATQAVSSDHGGEGAATADDC